MKINLEDVKFLIYFVFQSAFMTEPNHPINTLHDIKNMMERSSRFISLSGLSGISAGVCALIGAWFAGNIIYGRPYTGGAAKYERGADYSDVVVAPRSTAHLSVTDYLGDPLLRIAIFTFIAAFILAFTFTYLRSRKTGVPMWGKASKRLFINVSIPLVVGGLYILKLMSIAAYGLIAPGCLIFYGLALVNASKYTLGEVRYLGYCQLALGLANLMYVGYGLYFWALGFGVMHIIYGIAMWWRHERATEEVDR